MLCGLVAALFLGHGPKAEAWAQQIVRIHSPTACRLASSARLCRRPSVVHHPLACVEPGAQGGDAGAGAGAGSALAALIAKARFTAIESWRQQEAEGEGGEGKQRSASGGTSWADGSWLNKTLERELVAMMNSTYAYDATFTWLRSSPGPLYVELWESAEASIVLHIIPASMTMALPWLRPTGSKVLCRTLVGKLEVVQLLGDPFDERRRPMRQATRLLATPDKVLAYMGGPPRIYGSNVMIAEGGGESTTAVLEVALHSKGYMERSKRGFLSSAVGYEDTTGPCRVTSLPQTLLSVLLISPQYPPPPSAAGAAHGADAGGTAGENAFKTPVEGARDLEALDMSLLQASVGGERQALEALLRRTILSRKVPELARELGIRHVRGVLLYGPPGCGKTLIARTLARALKARPPKVIAAPELLDRWVGEAERRVRDLFFEAEEEWRLKGQGSALHVIIIDEIDAVTRARGSLQDATGVRDSVVAQFLSLMDGVNQMDNVLVVGLTNRRALMDEALLRPGRFEVQLEIALPDAHGRADIMQIHLRGLRDNGRISPSCYLWALDAASNEQRDGWSGAEIAGVVRAATARAVQRVIDKETAVGGGGGGQESGGRVSYWGDVEVKQEDLLGAFEEVSNGRPPSVMRASRWTRRMAAAVKSVLRPSASDRVSRGITRAPLEKSSQKFSR